MSEFVFLVLIALWVIGCLVLMVTKPDAFLSLWNARYDPELEREKNRQAEERRKERARIAARVARRLLK